jgi:superfamily II helicase
MTSRNSILLILKQRQGIAYTELLASILGDYSNINSARAALSRTLKDLEALGLIRRKGNTIFLTDKGLATLFQEMKNKLILRLNESIMQSNASELVKQLSVLIERSKADSELLKIAKESARFYTSDLEAISKETEKKIRQLNYINKVLKKHIRALKEMGFKDRAFFKREDLDKALSLLIKKEKPTELIITASESTLKELSELLNESVLANALVVPSDKSNALAEFFKNNAADATIAFHDILIKLGKRNEIIAPAKKLEFLR